MNRNEILIQLRPNIVIDETKQSGEYENFQNSTIRPILKFQNVALLTVMKKYLDETKFPKIKNEQERFITGFIQKNQYIKQQLIGMVAGFFTSEELKYYLLNSSILNKRIIQLVIKRVCDGMIN